MHAYTKGPLSRRENVSKAIRKKGHNAHARLNGLATDYVSQRNNKGKQNKKENPKRDSLFWKRWSMKNRIGLGGQVTYREGPNPLAWWPKPPRPIAAVGISPCKLAACHSPRRRRRGAPANVATGEELRLNVASGGRFRDLKQI
uniref:Uncharacterized protein n=1 Tax=Vitis vinifera TaxID=29760 RepID=A5BT68_VITVI|nr:hypothetical protein VITISV_039309 [Vitis vinifera]